MSKHIISCCTCTCNIFFHMRNLHSLFLHCVAPSQMDLQQGVAWGPSPGGEILNHEQKYIVHSTAHAHILTLITAPVCLTQILKNPLSLSLSHSIPTLPVLHESTKEPGSTIPPGQRLVTADCLYPTLLFCMTIIPQLPAPQLNPSMFGFSSLATPASFWCPVLMVSLDAPSQWDCWAKNDHRLIQSPF